MNIGFDVSDLATNRADGTTRYTRELLMRLPTLGLHDDWQLYSPGDFSAGHLPANVTKHISPWPKYWTQLRLPFDLYKTKPDILFMPIQQLPGLRPKKMKTVAVVHDLAFHKFPSAFTYKDWVLLHMFTAKAVREADSIIAVSASTANDIGYYYGRSEGVHVVHHGVNTEKFHVMTDAEKELGWSKLLHQYPNINKPYILYVGQIQPRKNIAGLVSAFEILKQTDKDLMLVVAGGHGWKQQEIVNKIKHSPVKDSIVLTGAVPDELLPALYAHAEVFALVSFYEGFGMPLLEAFACGTPVVTGNTSCLPEIAGDSAILVDPTDIQSIADGIKLARAQKNDLQAKGFDRIKNFTWEKTASQTYTILTA